MRNRFKIILGLSLLLNYSYAGDKKLILAEGNYWKPMMADNFIKNYKK